MYKLGLVSISFRQHSPRQILEAVKAAGLSCIEWGSDVHAPCHDTARLAEVVALQQEFGISCCSYGTYFRLGVTPLEELPAYIRAAKVLGTHILRLWCGDRNCQDYTPESRAALLAACKAAAALAQQEHVIFCLECHNNTFTNTVDGALWLMEQVDSPHFRMYWQPNQLRTTEENLRYARIIAPYTRYLHVFHWLGPDKFPLREGTALWQQYLPCFPGDHALLLEFMPDGKIETLFTEAQTLTELAGGNAL